MDYSPKGNYLITSSGSAVVVWDAASGNKLKTLQGHQREIEAVALSPDGRQCFLSAGYRDNALWDVDTGKKIRALDLWGVTRSVAFSPDGRLLVTTSGSGELGAKLWNVEKGYHLHTLRGHTSRAVSAVFSPDSKYVLTGSLDGTARIWDAHTGDELVRLIGLEEGKDWLAVTADGLFDGSLGARQRV